MKKAAFIVAAALAPTLAFGQAAKPVDVKDIVELELLTTSEAYDKIHNQGKTSVLLITGGTEARGPHNVLGGHTIMSRHRGMEIAKRLGNALLAPVVPVAVAATGVTPGTKTRVGIRSRPTPSSCCSLDSSTAFPTAGSRTSTSWGITAADRRK